MNSKKTSVPQTESKSSGWTLIKSWFRPGLKMSPALTLTDPNLSVRGLRGGLARCRFWAQVQS